MPAGKRPLKVFLCHIIPLWDARADTPGGALRRDRVHALREATRLVNDGVDRSARVDYLCAVAREMRAYKENWMTEHRRYYQIGGITLQVDSELPITDETFSKR